MGRRQFGSIRRLPSGRWQARYRGLRGSIHTESFATKGDAGRWLASVEADMARGEWINPKLGEATFGTWADEWVATTVHLKPKTRAAYESLLRRHVLPVFADRKIGSIEQVHVRRFVAELSAVGVAAGTVRNAYRILRLVLDIAVGSGTLRSNPAIGVKLPRSQRTEMVFLNAVEVTGLAAEIGPPYDLLVEVAAFTGLRAGELAGLRVGRLDLMRRVIDVLETIGEANGVLVSGPTKTHERRTVPIPLTLAERLAEHIADRATDQRALVFVSPDGGPLRHGNFYRRVFKPAVGRAGLPATLRFHDLRHTCAALLIEQGAHPKAIAEMLGHSTITVTLDRYGHLFPSITEGLAAKLDAVYLEAKAADPAVATVARLH